MNPKLNTKPAILSRSGSFWIDQSSKTDPHGLPLIRSISRLIDSTNADLRGEESVARLTGSSGWRYNFEHRFNYEDVSAIESSQGPVNLDDQGKLRDWDEELVPEYDWKNSNTDHHIIVRIPKHIIPQCIFSFLGDLTVGLAFTCGEGYIRFYVSPFESFDTRLIIFRSAIIKERHLLDYTLQIDDVTSSGYYIEMYYRDKNSIRALELALNELVGRVILRDHCQVLEVRIIDQRTCVYVLDNGTSVTVPYSHIYLTENSFYDKDTIIGQAVFISQSPDRESAVTQWIADNLPNGLSMKAVNPNFPDVYIPNKNVKFWAASQSTV